MTQAVTRTPDAPWVCPKCGGHAYRHVGVSQAPALMYVQCATCGHTGGFEHPPRAAFSELANALQAALLLSIELEASAPEHLDAVAHLQSAIRRAVAAMRQLQS